MVRDGQISQNDLDNMLREADSKMDVENSPSKKVQGAKKDTEVNME